MAFAAMISLTGCTDFLKRDPKLQQSTDLTLSTASGLDQATAGAYAYIGSTAWYGNSWVIDAEMRSGNGRKDNFAETGRCSGSYNWNYSEEATSGMWSYCYVTVAMCNNVIDNLEGKEDDEYTVQDLNNIKAECLFLRAFSHFCNVLTYGQPYTYCVKSAKESLGVPYVYHTDPAGKPVRETVVSNYENIVKDLLEAESLIDPEYSREGADPKAYANIYTIQALLSRVYLYMGEWQNAADYATKVIDSKVFKTWTASEYPTVWSSETGGSEVIFEAYGKRTNTYYGGYSDISWLTNPDGYGDPMAAQPLLNEYEADDVRLATYRTDKDEKSGLFWTGKYPGKGDNAAPDCNNVPIIRLSEMYLNRAEALMNGARVDGATGVKDLNEVALNRNASEYKTAGAADIQKERRRELAWEGHYLYDLARWGKSVTRNAADYPLCSSNNLNIPFPSAKWALPIPKRERDVNPNLVQNPIE